jgi:alanine racemase
MVPITYRCWMEVSRAQLAANLQPCRKAVGAGVEVMPVVKADAYRHGSVEVGRVLQHEGARWLAVSATSKKASSSARAASPRTSSSWATSCPSNAPP